jgi:hypothetical protein
MKLILALLIVAFSHSSNAVTSDLPVDLDINDINTFKGFDNKLGINQSHNANRPLAQHFRLHTTPEH